MPQVSCVAKLYDFTKNVVVKIVAWKTWSLFVKGKNTDLITEAGRREGFLYVCYVCLLLKTVLLDM